MAQSTGSTARTDLDFAAFRKRLEEERATAEAIIHSDNVTEARMGADTNMPTDEDDQTSLGSLDPAADLTRREQDRALINNARTILSRIERAVQKLDDGTYGLSDVSGKPIPVERLEALPYAVMTADEQEKYGY